ncbi:MAG: hypothetical protein PHC88_16680 [Terrimicrobiaceae bacterium]|nr:hypothetical protein [Terrimicrobiaceae bacterium]
MKDAVGITIKYFDSSLDPDLILDTSPALNLTPEQISRLTAQYENERQYYFQGQPPFGDLMETISKIRQALQTPRS